MEVKELIFKEIENVPEPYLIEILDFVRFLETKVMEQNMPIWEHKRTSPVILS